MKGLEKYLMTKLYDRTFGVDVLDKERDAAIGARLQVWGLQAGGGSLAAWAWARAVGARLQVRGWQG